MMISSIIACRSPVHRRVAARIRGAIEAHGNGDPLQGKPGRGVLLAIGVFLSLSVGAAERDGLEKRLDLVDHYLDSTTAVRIRESASRRAHDLLDRAIELREQARRALADGDLDLAEKDIGLALRSISAATTALAQEGRSSEDVARRNAALRDEIRGYRESFNQTVLSKGPQFASLLDAARVDELIAEADALSASGEHARAATPLQEAYQLTVNALTRLRENETVVYSLNFRTPADEYRYEEKRHESYALLVHQMVSSGAAKGSRAELVNRFLEQAARLAEQARREAGAGDHAAAIETMEDANQSMVRALQMMGLSIPG